MRLVLFALSLALLPACHMSVMSDAEAVCHKIVDSLDRMAARCHGHRDSDPNICENVARADRTMSQAEQCEAWTNAVACEQRFSPYNETCDIYVEYWLF